MALGEECKSIASSRAQQTGGHLININGAIFWKGLEESGRGGLSGEAQIRREECCSCIGVQI